MAGLTPGEYRIGVRPNHLALGNGHASGVPIEAVVDLAEISGSDTYLHLRHHHLEFIAQVKGVHSLELGAAARVWLDKSRIFAFDRDGRLAGAPAGNGG
jgi:glycerol transport system ATP-binding protein